MHKFSVVIITYNEEKIIEKCLLAAKQVSDDIVVIDSFSVDKTKAICEKLGANVIQQKWLGYSAQKNFANSYCNYDWILFLDADEILSEKAILEYKQIKFTDKNIIYEISRLNNYCGKWIKHGRWYPEWRKRLYNKNFAQWNNDLVHEDVETIEKLAKYKLVRLQGDVFHYSMQSKAEHLEKIELYARLSSEKLFSKSKKATFIKRFLSPISRFLVDFILKFGFLDGKLGFQIAWLSAYETYLKYNKLNALKSKK